MSTTGRLETPTKVGFTVVDAASGHALCHGILAALFRRARTGAGEWVQVSLYDVALHLQSGSIVEYLMTGVQVPRSGNSAPLTAPADLLRCGDGEIVISAYLQPHWLKFIGVLGAAHLADDPRFATAGDRIENRSALVEILEMQLASRTAEEWQTLLDEAGLLVGKVKDYAEVVASPYSTESEVFANAGDDIGIHNPVQTASAPRGPLPSRRSIDPADLKWST